MTRRGPITLAIGMLLVASGCGGGGGDPGTCSASAETCAALNAATAAKNVTVTVNSARVSSVACKDMGSLNEALAYLAAGASQLDGDKDGKPCEDEFPGQ